MNPLPEVNAERRRVVQLGAGLVAVLTLRPSWADVPELQAAIRGWTGGATVQAGRVKLEVAPLVDNGNVVPVTITVDSPMSASDHVAAIALFNEKNPQRDMVRATLGPRAGRARVSTRVRLHTSQQLVALARMSNGSVWSHTVDVVVTLAACIE
jgi:sulfur-oxidizing protein SoxY